MNATNELRKETTAIKWKLTFHQRHHHKRMSIEIYITKQSQLSRKFNIRITLFRMFTLTISVFPHSRIIRQNYLL